jgi:hypothetical protein
VPDFDGNVEEALTFYRQHRRLILCFPVGPTICEMSRCTSLWPDGCLDRYVGDMRRRFQPLVDGSG